MGVELEFCGVVVSLEDEFVTVFDSVGFSDGVVGLVRLIAIMLEMTASMIIENQNHGLSF